MSSDQAASSSTTSSNYYAVLGVPRDASFGEIRRAYKKLALTTHTDKKRGDQDATEFQTLLEAYEVLKDVDKRRWYDIYGKALCHEISKVHELNASPQPEESRFVSLATLCGCALATVYLIRIFDQYSYPIEWLLFLAINFFMDGVSLQKLPVAVIVALASIVLIDINALTYIINVAWFLWLGVSVGARSGLLDVSVNAALFLVVVACAFSLSESGAFGSALAQEQATPDAAMARVVSSALGSWTMINLVWSLVGRVLLGISVSSLAADWILQIEPRAAFHRDERKSSVLATVTSIFAVVPITQLTALVVWAVIWRIDGIVGVRLEYFALALLMFGITTLNLFDSSLEPAKRYLTLLSVVLTACVLTLGYFLPMLPGGALLVVSVAALERYMELMFVFDVKFGVTANFVCRAIAALWALQTLADVFLHPVSIVDARLQCIALWLIIVNWLPIGVTPMPALLNAVWRNEDMAIVFADDDDDNDASNESKALDGQSKRNERDGDGGDASSSASKSAPDPDEIDEQLQRAAAPASGAVVLSAAANSGRGGGIADDEDDEDEDGGDEASIKQSQERRQLRRLRAMLEAAAAASSSTKAKAPRPKSTSDVVVADATTNNATPSSSTAAAATGEELSEDDPIWHLPRVRQFNAQLERAKSDAKANEVARLAEVAAKKLDAEDFELTFDNWNSVKSQLSKSPQTILRKEEKSKSGSIECHFCAKRAETPKRCSACLQAMYCSVECQREDWSGHKLFCKSWQNILMVEKKFRINPIALLDHIERVQELEAAAKRDKSGALDDSQHAAHSHAGHSHSHAGH